MKWRLVWRRRGHAVNHMEGYKQAEWVLLDYVDFVVHVFSEKARKFYELERLWKSATRIEAGEWKAVWEGYKIRGKRNWLRIGVSKVKIFKVKV